MSDGSIASSTGSWNSAPETQPHPLAAYSPLKPATLSEKEFDVSLPHTLVLTSTLLLPLSAQQYSFQPFSIHGRPTYAQSINNRGAIVGYYSPPNSGDRAFKRHANGVFEFVTIPDIYDRMTLTGINNFGDLVGFASSTDRGITIQWGFTLTGSQGTYTRIIYADLDRDPFYRVDVNGLNSAGDFVGRSSSYGGFVNIGGVFSAVQFPGAPFTTPYGIAWDGTVVGCYDQVGTGVIAFLRGPHGNFLGLKIANAPYVCARGISNAAGKIVGSYQDTAGKFHGFVYDYLSDLGTASVGAVGARTVPVQVVDYPGATRTVVTGIDGPGMITGWADLSNGATISFIGTP